MHTIKRKTEEIRNERTNEKKKGLLYTYVKMIKKGGSFFIILMMKSA